MNRYTDVIVSLVFWAFYGPLSLVALYETGRQNHVLVTLLAGVIVILMYLVGGLALSSKWKIFLKPKNERTSY